MRRAQTESADTRHHDPDKADDAAKRHHRPDHQRDRRIQQQAHALQRHPAGQGQLVSQGQQIQLARKRKSPEAPFRVPVLVPWAGLIAALAALAATSGGLG